MEIFAVQKYFARFLQIQCKFLNSFKYVYYLFIFILIGFYNGTELKKVYYFGYIQWAGLVN